MVISEHAEVANAVGAAVGWDVEELEILIRPDSLTGKYIVFSPIDRVLMDTLEKATAYAFEIGEEYIYRMSSQRGYHLKKEQEDLEFKNE